MSISKDVNFETASLLWLDASANKSKENLETAHKLRSIIPHLQIFETTNDCEEYIRQSSTHDRLIIIVSGRLGQEILPQIHSYRQILSIYVYCMNKRANEEWAKHFTKIKNVINKPDKLLHQIRSDQLKYIENKVHEPLIINVAQLTCSPEKSVKKLDGDFLHWQLLIDCLLRMKTTSTARQQLITFCHELYRHTPTDLSIIKEFEQNYTPQLALWWYTRESCFYRLLNKALRVQNIDLLYLFRFFLGDLAKQLRQFQCTTSVRVYRGQMMSIEEVDQLKNSCGEYLSINTFFSTSLNRQKALRFLTDEIFSENMCRVLFEIDADPATSSGTSFANITHMSYYSHEEEILFLLGSIFRVMNIRQEKSGLWIIEMMLSKSRDKNLCSLFEEIKQQCGEVNDETTSLTLGNILYQMGKYDLAKKYFLHCLNDPSEGADTFSRCYHALGVLALMDNDYQSSLQWHQEVLQILIPSDPRLADSYNCIGCVYQKKGDVKQALDYYQRALNLWKNQFGEEHYRIADCLNNIGCAYEAEQNYSQALECHQKALAIRKKCLTNNHPDLAGSYNNIGNIYLCLEQYDLALENYQSSYEIKSKSLPHQHASLATTLENLALVYERKEQWHRAFDCYQKAADILQQTYPSGHPDIIEIQRKMAEISSILNSVVISTKL